MIWQVGSLVLFTTLVVATSDEMEDIVHSQSKSKKFKEEVEEELSPKHAFGGGYDTSYLGSSSIYPGRQPRPGVSGYPYPGGEVGTGFGGGHAGRPHSGAGGGVYPPVSGQATPYNKGACNVLYGEDILHCYTKSEFYLRKYLELQQYSPYIPEMEGPAQTCKHTEAHGGYQINFSGLQQQCLGPIQVTRIPYHMYNTKGEMRFIVQDPPNLQQCYSESICRRPPVFCSMLGYAPIVPCKPKTCYHTLLAWDPTSPQLGPFFDTFEYVCCCQCQTTVPLKASPFFNRFGRK